MDPSLDALADELSNKLGVRVVPASQGNGSLNAILRVRRLEPWNTVWGLPRPSHVAIQAGSCAVFQVQDAQGALDNQKLHELEMGGIGERTAEGFGQVCFNAPWITQSPRQWPKVSAGAENQTVGSSAHSPMSRVLISKRNSNHGAALFETARFLEKECWKQEIRRACLALASDSRKRRNILKWEIYDSGSGAPPMSQLGGLRNQVAAIRNRGDEAAAIDWIEHLESNPRRKEKWPENSLQEIKDILDNKDKIWQILASSDETLTDSSDTTSGNTTRTTNSNSPQWPTLTENAHSELKRELWPMAIRAFFDACIRAHKRDLEGQQ
jgi:CRISPR-associated protein Csx10